MKNKNLNTTNISRNYIRQNGALTALMLSIAFAAISCSSPSSPWVSGEAPAVAPAPPPPPKPAPAVVAPTVKYPIANSDVAAVAFEDRDPSHNDEDFNDFLTDFRIFEHINEKNQLTDVVVDFYPRAVGAWYDHQFLLILNGIKDSASVKTKKLPPLVNGPARVTVTYYGTTGNTPIHGPEERPPNQDLLIFDSTHALFTDANHMRSIINTEPNSPYIESKVRARVSITLLDPSQNPIDPSLPVDLSKFRMMLHVKDTNRDIDIIDVDQANFDKNRADGDEYPFGFIIPVNWAWPNEGVPISDAYPSFKNYRAYLQSKLANPQQTADDSVLKWYDAAPVASKVYSNQGKAIPQPELLPDPW
jgi:LruC domain-containing protein